VSPRARWTRERSSNEVGRTDQDLTPVARTDQDLTPVAPADWRWSSYRATIGLEPPGFLAIERLLDFFGDTRDAARKRYRGHVEAMVDDGVAAELRRSVVVGSDDFAIALTNGVVASREVARRHWQPVRPSLRVLLARPSNERLAHAYGEYGYTMREIADHLGVHYATVSRRIRRFGQALSECKT
jgi:hypothetical protein